MQLDEILYAADALGASDIHLVAGHIPMVRVDTIMQGMDLPMLSPACGEAFAKSITNDIQQDRLAI